MTEPFGPFRDLEWKPLAKFDELRLTLCWADSPPPGFWDKDRRYCDDGSCGRVTTNPIGLCDKHLKEFQG